MKKILTSLIFLSFHNLNFCAQIEIAQNIKAAVEYLNNGNDVNKEIRFTSFGQSYPLLFHAIYSKNFDLAELCIMLGADLNWRSSDRHGKPNIFDAFWILSEDQILPLLELLIRHKANINMQGNFNRTPLINVVKRNQVKVAHLLLETKKADITIEDDFGFSIINSIYTKEMLEIFKDYISKKEYDMINERISPQDTGCCQIM